jgi:hypothetical protein
MGNGHLQNVVGVVSVMITLYSPSALSATACEIRNSGSETRNVLVQSGTSSDCNSNRNTQTLTIGPQSSVTVPYGGNVTFVCARYAIGDQWSDWYTAGCPSDDNSLCYIEL